MGGSAAAIDVIGLTKNYDTVQAVRGIDLMVETGEVFALLGPNGAGKTTTVEILEGFRQRSGGAVTVLGHDPGDADSALRSRIGVVLQATAVDPYLTVGEVIDLYRGFYPDPRAAGELLELVGLKDQRDERVNRLSGGQQRRLDVAVGLAGDPDLLFLDEPTTGFDPAARRQFWHVIADLKDLGKTVLLTTHYMEEAEVLADRVAVIVDGTIVAEGTPADLGGGQTGTQISLLAHGEQPAALVGAERDGDHWRLVTEKPVPILHQLTEAALAAGNDLAGLQVRRRSLEDVYLELTASAAPSIEPSPESEPSAGRRSRGRR